MQLKMSASAPKSFKKKQLLFTRHSSLTIPSKTKETQHRDSSHQEQRCQTMTRHKLCCCRLPHLIPRQQFLKALRFVWKSPICLRKSWFNQLHLQSSWWPLGCITDELWASSLPSGARCAIKSNLLSVNCRPSVQAYSVISVFKTLTPPTRNPSKKR